MFFVQVKLPSIPISSILSLESSVSLPFQTYFSVQIMARNFTICQNYSDSHAICIDFVTRLSSFIPKTLLSSVFDLNPPIRCDQINRILSNQTHSKCSDAFGQLSTQSHQVLSSLNSCPIFGFESAFKSNVFSEHSLPSYSVPLHSFFEFFYSISFHSFFSQLRLSTGKFLYRPHSCQVHIVDGKLHNLSGPAVLYTDGSAEYWVNGNIHRLDGPAWSHHFGNIRGYAYYVDGQLHRFDGPAFEFRSCSNSQGRTRVEYWLNGDRFNVSSLEEFHGEIARRVLES